MGLPLTSVIQFRRPQSLTPHPRNARTHSDRQVHTLAAAIKEFRTFTPLFIDGNNLVLAGHARLRAAQELGLEQVPVIVLDHLTEKAKQAFMLADNKIALDAGWDADLLKAELEELSVAELDFDTSLTGFSTVEIDLLTGTPDKREKPNPLDRVEAIDRSLPSICRLGEQWTMGAHSVLAGDALNTLSYETLLRGEIAAQVFSDPPYNVKIDGFTGGLGAVHHADFAMASGEMSSLEFRAFLLKALMTMTAHVKDGAILMIFMDWRHLQELLGAAEGAGLGYLNMCVWDKINGGMGSLYRSQHELVLIFKHGKASHTNNVELGRHGRYRTNIWRYPGANMFRRGRQADLVAHPTVKPVALVMDAIKDCSNRQDLILDPFGGSGTTLLAAERTGRRARLIEIDPYYVDTAIRRWQDLTGRAAVNAETGETFAEAEQRIALSFEATEIEQSGAA